MKNLLLTAILAISGALNAQTLCELYVVHDYDKFNDVTNVLSNEVIAVTNGDKGIGVYCFKSHNDLVGIVFTVVGTSKCIDEGNKAIIVFTDGTRLTLEHMDNYTCEGHFTMYFNGIFKQTKELKILMEKDIEAVRVNTYRSHVQVEFTPEQAQQFKQTLICLMDGVKL